LFVVREGQIALERGDLANLDAAVAAWRGGEIAPLGSLRRRLKTGPPPTPDPATDSAAMARRADRPRSAQRSKQIADALGEPDR